MNFRTFFCTVSIIVHGQIVLAQNKQIDSLEKWVAQYTKQDTIWIKNMVKIERMYEHENPGKQGFYADKILDYSKKNNYNYGIEEGLANKAIYYSYKGQYQKAIETLMEKLKFDSKNNDLIRKIESYTLLATIFGEINPNGNQEKTLEYFLLANETAQQIPHNNPQRSRQIAKAKINVASGYYYTKQYEKALKVYLEASEIERKELNSLKDSPEKQKEIAYLNAVSSLNIGSLYFLLERYQEAEKSYIKGIELSKKFNFANQLVLLYISMADTYNTLNKLDLAKKYLQLTDEMDKKEKIEASSMVSHFENYEKYYVLLNDFKMAYAFQEKKIALNDSLAGSELQQKIKDLTIKYETDKKEQENKQLAEKNTTIEKQNRNYLIALGVFLLLLGLSVYLYTKLFHSNRVVETTNHQLQEANEQKNKLFKIISHDLKTPATAFVQLTHTINYYIKKQEYVKLLKIGETAQTLSNDLHSTVNNLLYWSMSQQGLLNKRTEKVYLEELMEELKEIYEGYCQIHQIALDIDSGTNIELNSNRMQLSTALRNTLSNAIKFSPKGEKIKVEIIKNSENVIIKIHDSGQGFTPEEIKNFSNNLPIKAKTGLHGEKSTGLGMTITKEIISLYDGSISIGNSELLKGACVTMILRTSQYA